MWNILFLYLSLSSNHLVYFFVNVKYFDYLTVKYRASNIFIFYNPIIFQLVLNILPHYQYLIFSCFFLAVFRKQLCRKLFTMQTQNTMRWAEISVYIETAPCVQMQHTLQPLHFPLTAEFFIARKDKMCKKRPPFGGQVLIWFF